MHKNAITAVKIMAALSGGSKKVHIGITQSNQLGRDDILMLTTTLKLGGGIGKKGVKVRVVYQNGTFFIKRRDYCDPESFFPWKVDFSYGFYDLNANYCKLSAENSIGEFHNWAAAKLLKLIQERVL